MFEMGIGRSRTASVSNTYYAYGNKTIIKSNACSANA